MNIQERRKLLQREALGSLGEQGSQIPTLEEIRTTDIESEEADIFERKEKFNQLLKRFEKHRQETSYLRGNDLRYNIYMRKLQKLTRMDLGLDVEAYKDYINNLKQFAHVNEDFELYARDQLNDDTPEMRELIDLGTAEDFGVTTNELHKRVKASTETDAIFNTLKKLKRDASGFMSTQDRTNLDNFIKNMRIFLNNENLFDATKSLYDKRQTEIEER